MNFTFDYNSFFSSIIGGSLTIIATYITLQYDNRKSIKAKKDEKEELCNKLFMELNYNKRKIIYTIENDAYRLTGLDNLHWKNFLYSKASLILINDNELIDDLATLDSMVDQTNYLVQIIKESETARICNIDHSADSIETTKRLNSSLKKYAKEELKPQMEKAIVKLERLFKLEDKYSERSVLEKKEKDRLYAGIVWVLIGVYLFVIYSSFKPLEMLKILFTSPIFLWSAVWTTIGVGSGLIDTRNHKYSNFLIQHIFYCGFVFVVILLLSFIIPSFMFKSIPEEFDSKFYSVSALIGLIGGFLGNILRDLVLKLLEKIGLPEKKKDKITDS